MHDQVECGIHVLFDNCADKCLFDDEELLIEIIRPF